MLCFSIKVWDLESLKSTHTYTGNNILLATQSNLMPFVCKVTVIYWKLRNILRKFLANILRSVVSKTYYDYKIY